MSNGSSSFLLQSTALHSTLGSIRNPNLIWRSSTKHWSTLSKVLLLLLEQSHELLWFDTRCCWVGVSPQVGWGWSDANETERNKGRYGLLWWFDADKYSLLRCQWEMWYRTRFDQLVSSLYKHSTWLITSLMSKTWQCAISIHESDSNIIGSVLRTARGVPRVRWPHLVRALSHRSR